jgi:acetyl-CoA acetyltransferase family protein
MKPNLFLIAGVRTPFCRAGSALADLDAVELGRAAVSALLTKTGVDPHVVDETILGCVGQPPQAQNVARVIALRAGLPQGKPAFTVHRNCASGLEAITTAHARLCAGQGEVFIVGGVESMSQMPLYFPAQAAEKFGLVSRSRSLGQRLGALAAFRPADFAPVVGLQLGLTDPVSGLNMGQTAEVLAREFGITREMQDAFALRSHLRAVSAGKLEEVVPVLTAKGAVVEDNGIRPNSTLEKLAMLPPLFEKSHGTVTAGNSSQITDGAVALLVASEAKVNELGVEPLGRLVDYAATGCDPKRMGLGPVSAMDRVLHRTPYKLSDFDLVEINEAFAAQVLAVVKAISEPTAARRCGLEEPLGDIDPAKLNLRGGVIALGHPVGATGARLVLSALHQLKQHNLNRALVSLCVGGGQGVAAIIERP